MLRNRKNVKSGLAGFTLLELLAVMAIILIMATIATTSYRSMISGTGIGASLSHLRQSMELARQSAIMQGKSTFVVFYQDASNSWYVTCMGEGYNQSGAAQQVQDRYNTDLTNGVQIGSLLYNLSEDTAKFTEVVGSESFNGIGTITCEDPIWHENDRYGWETTKRVRLPRGFKFKEDNQETVRFKPSGSATDVDGNFTGAKKVALYEEIRSDKEYSIVVDNNGLMKTLYK